MLTQQADRTLDIATIAREQNLSVDEVAYLTQALGELSKGQSASYHQLWAQDYDEMPVDIITFISDPRYLGKSWVDDQGNFIVYEFWRNQLKYLFSSEGKSKYEVALSGAIGLGKTNIAVIGLCYILHQLLCLKDPASYYKLRKGSRPAVAFLNVTLNQSYGVGFQAFQSMCLTSPWFRANGTVLGREDNQTYYPGKNIEWVVGSNNSHFLGRDIFCALLDELDFRGGQNDDISISSVMKLYAEIFDRMTSRFMSYGVIPGKLFLVSSKNREHDFLEEYIKKQMGKSQFHVVDEPVWKVLDKAKLGLSGKYFHVAIGDRYSRSRIIGELEDVATVERVQRVIEVPEEYRDRFELDINGALANIAGIALSSTSKFFSMEKVLKGVKSYLKNPFTVDCISLGFDDASELKDFFVPSQMSKTSISRPHHIHWDVSLTGDTTGLSMMVPSGTLKVRRAEGFELKEISDTTMKVVFAIEIKAVPGQEIPFHKIRKFIYYLHDELGIPIGSISGDSQLSRDSLQAFKLRGFNAFYMSVDRAKDAYYALKNAVNEERLLMPNVKKLVDEFENVVENSQKIDHTSTGTKNILDTLAANALKISQTYAEDPGVNSRLDILLGQVADEDDDLTGDWIIPDGITIGESSGPNSGFINSITKNAGKSRL